MNEPRMIAGAPVKHAPMPISVTQLSKGMWLEVYPGGQEIIVCDLTSWLWTYVEPKHKPRRW